ncbi:PAS domain S-box protein [Halobiforma nitratireducens]|uniref:histidine kinase n=1 Tax=Halobiforma nitratireducens JCM 10879 TaxID=1227454 RepID=M0M6X5_9EURY|nr:PAS domain S-box protein [Halobiforma nitratireducens]EMA41148.1 signal-transducing histidine kinase [Halobiforma nitratireducens JCM 10879]
MRGTLEVLTVGDAVPPTTQSQLSEREVRVRSADLVDGRLAGSQTESDQRIDCVVMAAEAVVETDDEPSIRLEGIRGEPAIVAVTEGAPSPSLLESDVTAFVRAVDIRSRADVLLNRVRTAVASKAIDGGPSSVERDEPVDDRAVTEQLERATEALRAVQRVDGDPDRDAAETIGRLLQTAAEQLDYPIGYATRIEGDSQEILAAVGDHAAIDPGAVDPLEETYSRHTLEADEPIVLQDALAEGWDDDPAFERFGLRCYVGAHVTVDDDCYGALCFADREPRDDLEIELQRSIVEALAERVGYELERRQYVETLERRERRLSGLFDEAPDGIIVHDADGTITDANRAATELLGYSRDELIGTSVFDIAVGIDPETLRDGWESLSAGETFSLEGVHQRADGTTYPVEVWVTDFDAGDERRFITMARDITERTERNRELERYERLWRQLPIGVCQLDPTGDGRILDANERLVELSGAESKSALLEISVADFWGDDDTPSFERVLEEGSVEFEHPFETLDGRTIWGQVTVISRERHGETYLDVVFKDVTERKKRERELEEQRDDLEVLNQVVRHDIRNDLQLVQAYAKMLERTVDEDGKDHLEIVRESTENAIELTATARDLADVMLRSEVESQRIALDATLERQLSEIRSTYPDAAVTIEQPLPSVEVVGNDMLDAVFRNLLKNAIQHNDTSVPTVTIDSNREDGYVHVRIADDGPGVPDSQKEEIFGKGEKGLRSDGTGIGLYLVRELVDDYGGEVWVEDNEPRGAIFVVRLPIAEATTDDRDADARA